MFGENNENEDLKVVDFNNLNNNEIINEPINDYTMLNNGNDFKLDEMPNLEIESYVPNNNSNEVVNTVPVEPTYTTVEPVPIVEPTYETVNTVPVEPTYTTVEPAPTVEPTYAEPNSVNIFGLDSQPQINTEQPINQVNPVPVESVQPEPLNQQPIEPEPITNPKYGYASNENANLDSDENSGIKFIIFLFILMLAIIIALPYIDKFI